MEYLREDRANICMYCGQRDLWCALIVNDDIICKYCIQRYSKGTCNPFDLVYEMENDVEEVEFHKKRHDQGRPENLRYDRCIRCNTAVYLEETSFPLSDTSAFPEDPDISVDERIRINKDLCECTRCLTCMPIKKSYDCDKCYHCEKERLNDKDSPSWKALCVICDLITHKKYLEINESGQWVHKSTFDEDDMSGAEEEYCEPEFTRCKEIKEKIINIKPAKR